MSTLGIHPTTPPPPTPTPLQLQTKGSLRDAAGLALLVELGAEVLHSAEGRPLQLLQSRTLQLLDVPVDLRGSQAKRAHKTVRGGQRSSGAKGMTGGGWGTIAQEKGARCTEWSRVSTFGWHQYASMDGSSPARYAHGNLHPHPRPPPYTHHTHTIHTPYTPSHMVRVPFLCGRADCVLQTPPPVTHTWSRAAGVS
jgi:hypothetical protein